MTTVLCGVWSLSGETVERLLPVTRRRALSAACGERPEEVLAGPLWLACARGALVRDRGRIIAWDGFISFGASGPWELAERLIKGGGLVPADGPPGHYVAAYAEPSRGALTLLRDPTGGARLYFSVRGALLFFATSLKFFQALDDGAPMRLDLETAFERGLSELIHFGDGTLIEGVREVLPGHRMTVEGRSIRQEWAWGKLLEPLEGDVPSLAQALRRNLMTAVERCIGGDGQVAVALSGGIDSASVAALAAQAVGPGNVHAFTFEYADPIHPSEVSYAAQVCRWLGIRDHRVVRISFDDFIGVIPAAVWLAEDPGYWKRSYSVLLSRAVRAAGFEKFLTGFGIGSHMSYFEELSRVLAWLPFPQRSLRCWSAARRQLPGKSSLLGRLHPGLEPPISRLYYPTLCLLRARGFLSDLGPFFPAGIGPRVERMLRSPRVVETLRGCDSLPLAAQLQFLAFIHMNSCVDVVRSERISREVGAAWLGPAHFPACLPLCYLPVRPTPPLWDARRRLRPGKLLLTEAMRGALPEAILGRKKYWLQTNGPRLWWDRALARMETTAGPSWDALRPAFGAELEVAKGFAPEGTIPLAFWHRLLLTGGQSMPPTWEQLESGSAR